MTRLADSLRAMLRAEMAEKGVTWNCEPGEEDISFFAMACGFLTGQRTEARAKLHEARSRLETMATCLPIDSDEILFKLLSEAIEKIREVEK